MSSKPQQVGNVIYEQSIAVKLGLAFDEAGVGEALQVFRFDPMEKPSVMDNDHPNNQYRQAVERITTHRKRYSYGSAEYGGFNARKGDTVVVGQVSLRFDVDIRENEDDRDCMDLRRTDFLVTDQGYVYTNSRGKFKSVEEFASVVKNIVRRSKYRARELYEAAERAGFDLSNCALCGSDGVPHLTIFFPSMSRYPGSSTLRREAMFEVEHSGKRVEIRHRTQVEGYDCMEWDMRHFGEAKSVDEAFQMIKNKGIASLVKEQERAIVEANERRDREITACKAEIKRIRSLFAPHHGERR